jgi:predicted RNase H-like nuclease (RuvC/YqgF family)
MFEIKEKVKQLKQFQDELEKIQQKKKEIEEKVKSEIEEVKNEISLFLKKIEDLKTEINNETVKQFNESGEKNFYGGISVKEYEVINYSEKEAENGAKIMICFLYGIKNLLKK